MTFGAELADADKSAYPVLIATALSMDLYNHAENAGSNSRVLRTTLLWVSEYLQNSGRPEDLFVLIGWTGPDRHEFALASEEHSDPKLFWRSLHVHYELANETSDFVRLRKLIRNSFWCERECMTRYLVTIASLQGFLASQGIRFCFSQALPICHSHPELVPLVQAVDRKRFYGFMDTDKDFFTCFTRAKLPGGPNFHPLEQAHEFWARQLLPFIRENCLL